jgi:rhamnosyltransferase subunit B
MIVVPFGQDQPDNARRCVEAGVARTIARGHYTVERLTRDLGALLSEPSYEARAREVAAVVEAEDGTRTACDHIEQVLDR